MAALTAQAHLHSKHVERGIDGILERRDTEGAVAQSSYAV